MAALPAALIAFWWWRGEFRRAWVDAAEDLPEGVELANDDWRLGLILVVGTLGFLALRAVLRLATHGQF